MSGRGEFKNVVVGIAPDRRPRILGWHCRSCGKTVEAGQIDCRRCRRLRSVWPEWTPKRFPHADRRMVLQ